MDKVAIYQSFVATYHPDANVHKQAEINIRMLEQHDGFLPVVLEIVASEELELGARQAAAIYFKNRIKTSWDPPELNEHDKIAIKQNILGALVQAPGAVQIQLTSSLNTMLTSDFPGKWPDFLEKLQHLLAQTTDLRLTYVGLLALREVVRLYEWKDAEQREPLQDIVQLSFPGINSIMSHLVQSDSLEAAEVLKQTLKIYHAACEMDLPKCLQDTNSLLPWCTLFVQLIEKPTPHLPDNLMEREKYPWSKAKKWAYRCLNRLFGKYGNPALQPSNSTRYAAFGKNFVTHFAPNILQTYLSQLDKWTRKELWMPRKCLALTAAFLDDSIKHKTTWQLVKSHTNALVTHFIFPLLCFSAEDEAMWVEDPIDYVHKKIDPSLDGPLSVQLNVINLLVDLVRDRRKQTFTDILNFVSSTLNRYLETSAEARDSREKDGALCIMGCLAEDVLDDQSPAADMMESFFVTHVFPEFKSNCAFLRARASALVHQYSQLQFDDEQNLSVLYESVLACLQDPELPVRVQASLMLQSIIPYTAIKNAMIQQNSIPFIIQELLKLTDEIDADILAQVTEEFVEAFAKELTPFAVELCTQLRGTFMRIMEERSGYMAASDEQNAKNTHDVNDKTVAAMGVLKTIGTLILSLEGSPDVLGKLEEILVPMIGYTLEKRVHDLYAEIFDMIDSCIFSAKHVTPVMWNVFSLMYDVFRDSGSEYIEEMHGPLETIVAYGSDMLNGNQTVQQMMINIIEITMTSDTVDEKGLIRACHLIELVLLHYRGAFDGYIGLFLHLAIQRIVGGNIKSTELRVHCQEVVINCIYYDPALTLRLLEEKAWTQSFFSMWFGNLDKFTRVHDKKLAIVALCATLQMPFEQIPNTLRAIWPQLLQCIIWNFQSLPQALENRADIERDSSDEEQENEMDSEEEDGDDLSVDGTSAQEEREGEEEEEEEEEEDEDEDEEEEDGDENEDEDADIDDEDKEYLEFLTQQAAKNSGGNEGLEDEDDELQEEITFQSPLDDVDPYLRFEQVFKVLQQTQPESYNLLTVDLNQEQQNVILSVLLLAEERRNENQQKNVSDLMI